MEREGQLRLNCTQLDDLHGLQQHGGNERPTGAAAGGDTGGKQ